MSPSLRRSARQKRKRPGFPGHRLIRISTCAFVDLRYSVHGRCPRCNLRTNSQVFSDYRQRHSSLRGLEAHLSGRGWVQEAGFLLIIRYTLVAAGASTSTAFSSSPSADPLQLLIYLELTPNNRLLFLTFSTGVQYVRFGIAFDSPDPPDPGDSLSCTMESNQHASRWHRPSS